MQPPNSRDPAGWIWPAFGWTATVVAEVACGRCGNGPCSYPSMGPNFRRNCGGGFSPYSGVQRSLREPASPFCYVIVGRCLYMERDGKERYSLSPNFAMNADSTMSMVGGSRSVVFRTVSTVGKPVSPGLLRLVHGRRDQCAGRYDRYILASQRIDCWPLTLSAFNDTTIASTQRYDVPSIGA